MAPGRRAAACWPEPSTPSIIFPKTIHWPQAAAASIYGAAQQGPSPGTPAVHQTTARNSPHADRWRQVPVLRPRCRQGRPRGSRRPRQVLHQGLRRVGRRQVEGRVLLAEGLHLRLPDRDRRVRQAEQASSTTATPWSTASPPTASSCTWPGADTTPTCKTCRSRCSPTSSASCPRRSASSTRTRAWRCARPSSSIPQGIIRFVSVNDLYVGRNPQEVLRVLDALQTDELCPCNWQKGEEVLKAEASTSDVTRRWRGSRHAIPPAREGATSLAPVAPSARGCPDPQPRAATRNRPSKETAMSLEALQVAARLCQGPEAQPRQPGRRAGADRAAAAGTFVACRAGRAQRRGDAGDRRRFGPKLSPGGAERGQDRRGASWR